MLPVSVPTASCAHAVPGQDTVAINANAARHGLSMLSLPLVWVIDRSNHNRDGVCGTRPITSLDFGFGPSPPQQRGCAEMGTENALPAKASHLPANKSTCSAACAA